jgi:hypothetical protein
MLEKLIVFKFSNLLQNLVEFNFVFIISMQAKMRMASSDSSFQRVASAEVPLHHGSTPKGSCVEMTEIRKALAKGERIVSRHVDVMNADFGRISGEGSNTRMDPWCNDASPALLPANMEASLKMKGMKWDMTVPTLRVANVMEGGRKGAQEEGAAANSSIQGGIGMRHCSSNILATADSGDTFQAIGCSKDFMAPALLTVSSLPHQRQGSELLPDWLTSAMWAGSSKLVLAAVENQIESSQPAALSPDTGSSLFYTSSPEVGSQLCYTSSPEVGSQLHYTVMTGHSPTSENLIQSKAASGPLTLNAVKSFEFQATQGPQCQGSESPVLKTYTAAVQSSNSSRMFGRRVVSTEVTLKPAHPTGAHVVKDLHPQQVLFPVRECSLDMVNVKTVQQQSSSSESGMMWDHMGSPQHTSSHGALSGNLTSQQGAILPSVVSIGITVPAVEAAASPAVEAAASPAVTNTPLLLAAPMAHLTSNENLGPQPSEPISWRLAVPHSHHSQPLVMQQANGSSHPLLGGATPAIANYPGRSATGLVRMQRSSKRSRRRSTAGTLSTLSASKQSHPSGDPSHPSEDPSHPSEKPPSNHIGWGATLAPEPESDNANSRYKRTFGYSTVISSGRRPTVRSQSLTASPFSHGPTITAATPKQDGCAEAVEIPKMLTRLSTAAHTSSSSSCDAVLWPGARIVETNAPAAAAAAGTMGELLASGSCD